MSPDLASSDWCEFELGLAIASRATLLPVVLPGLTMADLTYSMNAVLLSVTYVAWKRERAAKEFFWKRVREAVDRVLKKEN